MSKNNIWFLPVLFLTSTFCLADDSTNPIDINAYKNQLKGLAVELSNKHLPDYVQINYVQGDGDSDDTWSVTYDYEKEREFKLTADRTSGQFNFGGKGYTFFAKGNYAFNENENSEDLSEIGASYHYRDHIVKIKNPWTISDKSKYTDCISTNETEFSEENEDEKCISDLGLQPIIGNQYYFDGDAHVKVEGNQDFDERNYVFGLGIATTMQLNESSPLQWLNILDYPARLFRGKTGRNSNGLYNRFPTLKFGFEYVEPEDDEKRAALEEEDGYQRGYAEIYHSSPIAEYDSKLIMLDLHYRYFHELSASDAIKASDLDVFRYYSVALQIPTSIVTDHDIGESNIILSYSSGELPFSKRDQEVFELGFRSNVDFASIFTP